MAKYRANAQDTWKTLKIKALDSMPVGTIVDYDGEASDIPVGWEEYTDNVVVLYTGTTTFGNDVITIPSDYKYIDVYIQTNYSSSNQGGTILRVDTSTTPSTNQTKGCVIPLGDTIFIECEINWQTTRMLRAGWVGHYANFGSTTANAHNKDSNYYVYKVIGYK